MLSVPLQRDGQPDADEIKIVSEIGAWLKVNGEAIYATRPWKIYGEGPSTQTAEKASSTARRMCPRNRSRRKTSASRSRRMARSLYAIVLEIPKDGKVTIKSLATKFGKVAGQNRQRPVGWRR